MSKKSERMNRIFTAIEEENGGFGRVLLTPRAIWMSARELGADEICMYCHSVQGDNVKVPLSPSAVMASFDRNDDNPDDGYVCYVMNGPLLELAGSSGDGADKTYTWEDMLRAGRPQAAAPDSITIDGRVYTLDGTFDDKGTAEARVTANRADGLNSQMRKKGGRFAVYTRPRAPKKEKPAKKAKKAKSPRDAAAAKATKAVKKSRAKKTPQPKAKKPSSRKKAGGKGKA